MKHFYFRKLAICLSVAGTVAVGGCQKELVPTDPISPGQVNKVAPDGFNYNTSKTVQIEIRLLTNTNQPISGVPVNFFDPKSTSSTQSLFKAISDKNGNVTGTLTIPGYLDTMVVRTSYIGLPVDVKVKLVNNTLLATIGGSNGVSGNVVADVQEESGYGKISLSASTKAGTDFSYPINTDYPNLFDVSGRYVQSDGRPSYLAGKDAVSASLLDNINASLPEGQELGSTHPDYMASSAVNTVNMVKASEVWVTFVHEGAGYKNSLAYYVYDTNNPPTTENAIKEATYVFPNATTGVDGALETGDKVKLKNVPAGKSIGFVLLQDAWSAKKGPKGKYSNYWGVNTGSQKFYSNTAINPESTKKKHSIMLYDDENDLFVMGFEDLNRESASANNGLASDNDFNDLVIYITSNPVDAISTDGVPIIDKADDADGDGVKDNFDEFPNDPTRAYKNYYPARDAYATIAFEDNWPKTGDYDLNDLVMKYRYTYVTNAQNKVVELFAEYDVAASGADNKNGFGVEFPFSSSLIKEVTGQKISGSYIQFAANGTEAGQSKAVIIPFDSQDNVVRNPDGVQFVNTLMEQNKVSGEVINLKISFNSPIDASTLGEAPYNPFLISNGQRGVEIHLPGYSPTNKADKSLFGTEADNSSETANRYYLTTDNRPWGLNFTEQFDYPVERQNIENAYLHYMDWARSGGKTFTDWYKTTGSEYRNTAYIYTK